MDSNVISRQSISEDARRAAERYIASGAEQPNPHIPGSDAFLCWATDYARHLHELQAVAGTEGSA